MPRFTAIALCFTGLLLAACDVPDSPPSNAAGERVFTAYCSACHQTNGGGTPGGPPPLRGSSWVDGPPPRIIRVVLHGLRGEVEVAKKTYNLEMPGFGPILSDDEIAAVLTYVRFRFGVANSANHVVAPAEVARIRSAHADRIEYWTMDELDRL